MYNGRPDSAAWSLEEMNKLCELWGDPKLTTTEIGRLLGRTKNSVIGRAHRLKLPRRKQGIQLSEAEKQAAIKSLRPRPRKISLKPKRVVVALPTRHKLRPIQMENLKPPLPSHGWTIEDPWPQGYCRYPVYEGPITKSTRLFCGEPAIEKCSYCLEHLALTIEAPRQAKEAA